MKIDLTGLKLEVGFYFSIIAKSMAPQFINADQAAQPIFLLVKKLLIDSSVIDSNYSISFGS